MLTIGTPGTDEYVMHIAMDTIEVHSLGCASAEPKSALDESVVDVKYIFFLYFCSSSMMMAVLTLILELTLMILLL